MAKFERKFAQDILKQAMRRGFATTLAMAKANAATFVGGNIGNRLAASLQIRVMPAKFRKRGEWGLVIQHKAGTPGFVYTTKKTSVRYYIPAAIEYGHAFPGRGGRKGAPKDVAPIRYMKPAFESTKNQAIATVTGEIKKGIEAALPGQ